MFIRNILYLKSRAYNGTYPKGSFYPPLLFRHTVGIPPSKMDNVRGKPPVLITPTMQRRNKCAT